jgi:hypothetical protein
MYSLDKIKYWYEKLPEIQSNIEPLTQLMIRTTGESHYYVKKNPSSSNLKIVNSKDINLLHSIDRDTAITKLLDRVKFLKKHKKEIKILEKKNGFIDLMSFFFTNSPFQSINSEIIAEVGNNNSNKKYLTLSGVGRIGAIKIVFPEGINLKIEVDLLDSCLKKRLIAINNLYIYSNRFENLKKYGIDEKEIIFSKRSITKKCYNRKKFLKNQTR